MSPGLPITKSRYWQSLKEASDSDPSEKIFQGEFPDGLSEWLDPLSRRKFLKLMSASIALAGVGACTRQPLRTIVPYVRQPEEVVPGQPLFYATALTLAGFARGVLVETHEGRPTKIEGNPDHPASRGASDIFMQAEILVLYDPDRSQAVIEDGQVSNWDSFLGYLAGRAKEWRSNGARGLRVLTRHETSPTFRDQMERLALKYPTAVWHEYEAVPTNIPDAVYHFDKAEIIFSIGADFLAPSPASLVQQRDFAAARRVTDRPQGMNRLYVVESTPTLTGAMSDHRIAIDPNGIADLLRGIRTALESDGSKP